MVLLTEKHHLPPAQWLQEKHIETITDWEHSRDANKVLRIWEHQEILSAHFAQWISWHDDMLLLREVPRPEVEFARPRVRHGPKNRPNKKMSNWHTWLWDTLNFFECMSIPAPNPVLHIPRLIRKDVLQSIPNQWDRRRLLFEPTYHLWHWECSGQAYEETEGFRICVFKGDIPDMNLLLNNDLTILNWGKRIDHEVAQREFAKYYPLHFDRLNT